jgi:hypothetical protein
LAFFPCEIFIIGLQLVLSGLHLRTIFFSS